MKKINIQQNNPNYQISGIEPNYSYNGIQNLSFDQSSISTSGYSSIEGLNKAVEQQQNFINNNNNYNPMSTFDRIENNSSNLENLRNFSQYNINKNFEIHKPILDMPDLKNRHETLYDNLNDNLMKESVKEFRLNIDSIDRDVEIYPDPFNYVIHLGPITNSGINASVSRSNMKQELKSTNKKKNINNKENSEIKETLDNNNIFIFDNPQAIKDYTIKLINSSNPYIVRKFENVSYVKLDCAVIPKYNSVGINYHWDFCRKKKHKRKFFKDEYDRIKDYIILNDRYIPDENDIYNPLGDRFVQIFINELISNRNFGTNSISDKSFILVYDKTLGALYLKHVPYSATKLYKEVLLGNLNRLTVKFYDSWGNPLTLNTSNIDYEKNQIINTKLFDPEKCNLDDILEEYKKGKIKNLILNFNEIIKCFIIINYNIDKLIPFYTKNNNISEYIFNDDCINNELIYINEDIFEIKDIYEELNEFVTLKGFVNTIKKTKSNKQVNLSIDEYINNIIWYDLNNEHIDILLKNIKAFYHNYINFGFLILDKLKNELILLPKNKNFQNFLTFLLGIYENDLNTKIDYNK